MQWRCNWKQSRHFWYLFICIFLERKKCEQKTTRLNSEGTVKSEFLILSSSTEISTNRWWIALANSKRSSKVLCNFFEWLMFVCVLDCSMFFKIVKSLFSIDSFVHYKNMLFISWRGSSWTHKYFFFSFKSSIKHFTASKNLSLSNLYICCWKCLLGSYFTCLLR